jgi:hypothetical protein
VLIILAVVGGIIGVAIFEKRKDGGAPPAAPGFGGPSNAPGSYGAGV